MLRDYTEHSDCRELRNPIREVARNILEMGAGVFRQPPPPAVGRLGSVWWNNSGTALLD